MDKNPAIRVVGSDCGKPEKEKEFNDWYNNVHVSMMLKGPYVKKAARYERIGDDDSYPKYLAIYDFESSQALDEYMKSPHRAKVLEDSGAKAEAGEFVARWQVNYRQIGSWRK